MEKLKYFVKIQVEYYEELFAGVSAIKLKDFGKYLRSHFDQLKSVEAGNPVTNSNANSIAHTHTLSSFIFR